MFKTMMFFLALAIWVSPVFAHPNSNQNAEPPKSDQGSIQFLPGIAGDYFALDSQTIGRRFHIFVNLPESYGQDPERKYPVSYILDGDTIFPMIAPTQLFLTYDEKLSETIVVGIAYGGLDPKINKRHIDFRPILKNGDIGGAGNFLEMLITELLPKIDTKFATDTTRRTLFGQSRGGSFVLYAANESPETFHGYIASNPANEWDQRLYASNPKDAIQKTQSTVIVTSGSRDRDYLRKAALLWGQEIASRDDLPWRAKLITIKGGTHAASAAQAYSTAMVEIYKPIQTAK